MLRWLTAIWRRLVRRNRGYGHRWSYGPDDLRTVRDGEGPTLAEVRRGPATTEDD